MVGALKEAVCFKLGIDYEAEIVSIKDYPMIITRAKIAEALNI